MTDPKDSTSPLGTILSALNRAMGRTGYVQKTGKNQFHGFTFASERDLIESLRPALVQEGLLLLPSLESITGPDEHGTTHVVVAYTLCHVSGAVWPTPLRVPGAGNDRSSKGVVGDKGAAKALTAASKAILQKLMLVATGDDPEADVEVPPANVPAPQPASGPASELKAALGAPAAAPTPRASAATPHAARAAALIQELPGLALPQLPHWCRRVDQLGTDDAKNRCWRAYEARCAQLGVDPRQASVEPALWTDAGGARPEPPPEPVAVAAGARRRR